MLKMLKWKDVDVVRALVVTTPGYVRDATPADILACLNANPEALTAEQWASGLAALSPETQDGITDALLSAPEVKWGTSPPRNAALHWKARAEKAERDLFEVRNALDVALCLVWEVTPETVASQAKCMAEMVAERNREWGAAAVAKEQAERELAEAKYWLNAHKQAAETLVDPVTGHGFFMLIGKDDDNSWHYTFGGPYDSYTLCERDEDEDPHLIAFCRERYDHDQGGWVDGVEVVEPVPARRDIDVAPYCLEDMTDELDQMKRERDEARAEAQARLAESLSVANVCAGLRGQVTALEQENDSMERRRVRETESLAHDHARAVAERDEARDRLRYTCQALVEATGADGPLNAEESAKHAAGQLAALRSRIAKLEAVVEAARADVQSADALLLAFEHGAGGTLSERVEQVTRKSRAALRALDEDKTPGSSSGLPDAADAPQATAQPEQRNESPQDALGNGGARGTFSGGLGAASQPVRTATEPHADNVPATEGSDDAGTTSVAPVGDNAPEPAGSSHDPLAALEAAVGRPLTADDRERIQGVVARLRPDVPRGGLLPEPLERGPRPDYSTRSEDGFITRGELVKALKELEALRRYWYFRNCGCDAPSYDDTWPEFAALAEILQNAG